MKRLYLKQVLIDNLKCIVVSGVPYTEITEGMSYGVCPDIPGFGIHDLHKELSDDGTIVIMEAPNY